jgi:hypothetical protein
MRTEQQGLPASDRSYLVLREITSRTTPLELAELAEAVATRDDGLDASDEDTIDRVKASLHHCVLPKMADLDVLDYDYETHVIDS